MHTDDLFSALAYEGLTKLAASKWTWGQRLLGAPARAAREQTEAALGQVKRRATHAQAAAADLRTRQAKGGIGGRIAGFRAGGAERKAQRLNTRGVAKVQSQGEKALSEAKGIANKSRLRTGVGGVAVAGGGAYGYQNRDQLLGTGPATQSYGTSYGMY